MQEDKTSVSFLFTFRVEILILSRFAMWPATRKCDKLKWEFLESAYHVATICQQLTIHSLSPYDTTSSTEITQDFWSLQVWFAREQEKTGKRLGWIFFVLNAKYVKVFTPGLSKCVAYCAKINPPRADRPDEILTGELQCVSLSWRFVWLVRAGSRSLNSFQILPFFSVRRFWLLHLAGTKWLVLNTWVTLILSTVRYLTSVILEG